MKLIVSRWQSEPIKCIYLNGYRIAGGKPRGLSQTVKEFSNVDPVDVLRSLFRRKGVAEEIWEKYKSEFDDWDDV